MPDPNLQHAMNEVRDILKAHDCMGVIVLASKTHSEFAAITETTWTCTTDHPEGFRIASKGHSAQEATDTVGSIGLLMDSLGHLYMGMNELWERLKTHMVVTGRNRLEEPRR